MIGFTASAGAFGICFGLWDVLQNGDSWMSEAGLLSGGLTLIFLGVLEWVIFFRLLPEDRKLPEDRRFLAYMLMAACLASSAVSVITTVMG